jgi:hypothetical protein
MQWVAVRYFCLYYGGNSCVAAVVYLACEDVVLDALVLFFMLVSAEHFRSEVVDYGISTFGHRIDIGFVLLDEGTILRSFSVFM